MNITTINKSNVNGLTIDIHDEKKFITEKYMWSDGSILYYQNGRLHRLDGPAVEWNDGTVEYWINGNEYTEEDYKFITFCMGNSQVPQ